MAMSTYHAGTIAGPYQAAIDQYTNAQGSFNPAPGSVVDPVTSAARGMQMAATAPSTLGPPTAPAAPTTTDPHLLALHAAMQRYYGS